ncbi:MAG TPA: hypothetical protein DCW33_01155, partial [Proteobacteria bacterium]|nr:hypothetical protein [Pseudomonadota bacterium]
MKNEPSREQQQTSQQLMEACKEGHDEDVSKLPEAVADINAKYEDGRIMLTIAYDRGNESVVKRLIDTATNLNITDGDGQTALMIACKRVDEKIISQLIEAEVDVNAKDHFRKTALTIACKNGHEAVVKQLTEAIKVHELMEACKKGYGTVDSQLIAGVDTNARDQALGIACWNGHEEGVSQLIDAGADVNAIHTEGLDGRTVLSIASYHEHKAIVGILIARGADIDAKDEAGNTALIDACIRGHEAGVKNLIALR